MKKDSLDYYIIPHDDAHGSEYVGISDKRLEWISGFTGTAGTVVVSNHAAYLLVDSRYWLQVGKQCDRNWTTIRLGDTDAPNSLLDWLIDRVEPSSPSKYKKAGPLSRSNSNASSSSPREVKVGIDARMISHEHATKLNNELSRRRSKLIFPPQNFVDLIWKDKPQRSQEPIFVQPIQFTGTEAGAKLDKLRRWIAQQPASNNGYSSKSSPNAEPKPAQRQVATLISNLACIAWVLNLRGDDIPFNPVFYAYLFVSLEDAILFVDPGKVGDEVHAYLRSVGVKERAYNDVWTFLRRKEWGEGKIIITPQTSYAISLMLTSFRYTILPSPIEEWKAVKNETEIRGLRNAYLRDGAAYVRWLAWLEQKMGQGYDITEYEAAWRLTEFRRELEHYRGLAYENISATGANAALPHYVPHKEPGIMISRETPYLNDSGGQYRDGTCDTTRTVHFGRPTNEQCEAYTRVLQGHIAIDSAVFPEGTSGDKLDVLARRALWQDGMNYGHGTGHGVGSYLNVHEGPHGFSQNVPLVPGHVVTNEPGYYKEGQWGMRIESALVVKRANPRNADPDGQRWLAFERLTCVPIQTKMVKENMLSKDEKQWIKDHNKRCYERLEPLIRHDKRALKWLRRESERGIGLASVPGGVHIDWD
ncbi:Creatinase/aminopeptidase [Panus rudis PR-1116 ss-1]|nr:Creatinase/aminopeptidase [Panus rudis PR-1116 ss-1]